MYILTARWLKLIITRIFVTRVDAQIAAQYYDSQWTLTIEYV